MGALTGITVLDLSRLLPGPYCSLLLADYGAEVIKIEEPELGDYIRWGNPAIEGIGSRHLTINRNKKSVTLNLKKKEGQTIFKKIGRKSGCHSRKLSTRGNGTLRYLLSGNCRN